jgi:GTP cyclohydrolase FolE2
MSPKDYMAEARDLTNRLAITGTQEDYDNVISTALRSAHAAGKAEGREEVKELVSELECCYQSLCPCSKDAVDKARSLPQPAPAKGESHK